MLDRFLEALTGRRVGGALFVLGGLIVVAAVFTSRGGDDPPKPKIQPTRLVSVPQLGLAFAHPRAWKRTVSARVIRLRSPDRSSVMTFASPLSGRQPARVKQALRVALLDRLKPAKILRDGPARLGRQEASSFELRGTGAKKRVTRVLVFVASTKFRTYAVTLLTPARPSAKRLAEAQQILATVSLSQPRKLKKRR
jgi:hypothetical protein